MDTDKKILELSFKILSEEFDNFIGKCLDDCSRPQAPEFGDIMKAWGCLPQYCDNAFQPKKK